MKQNRLYLAWMTAALLTMAGCSDELGNNVQQGKPIEGDGVYMTVNIKTPASSQMTKAGGLDEGPAGGEEGDGNLPGFREENYVRSVTVILYKGGENINDEDAEVVVSGYQDEVLQQENSNDYENHDYSATIRLNSENLETNVEYRVLTVVNADVSDRFQPGLKLTSDEFREIVIDNHRKPGETTGGFIMSTHQEKGTNTSSEEKESTVTFSGNETTSANAAKTEVWVERLSARLDYIGDGEEKEATQFEVKVPEYTEGYGNLGAGTTIATATIEQIAPINVATHDMYTFKRVTAGAKLGTNDITLLGDEKPNPNTPNLPVEGENYVIEPTTSSLNDKKFANQFKSRLLETIQSSDNKELQFKDLSEIIKLTTDASSNAYKGRILCYAGENTMGVNSQKHRFSTGIIIKATYDPAYLLTYAGNGKVEWTEGEYTRKGFYKVGKWQNNSTDPTDEAYLAMESDVKIYADLAAAEAECMVTGTFNGTESSPIAELRKNFTDKNWFKRKTWAELKQALDAFGNKEDLGYYQFLLDEYEQNTKNAGQPITVDLDWNTYLGKRSDIPSNETATNKYSNKTVGQLGVQYYGTDHTCYYQYWIRHANNGNPTKMGVMEFCIVRNNVYQMKVTGINGLGLIDPFDYTPDVPNEGEDPQNGYYLEVKLYVKNWVKRINDNIILQ